MRANVRTSSRPGRRFHPLPPRVLRPLPSISPTVRSLDAAGQQRVRAFCTLAYKMAWRFARHQARDIPPEELVGEALCGLTYAASMFQENRGVPFAAYATLVVRHRLIRAILDWRREKWIRPLPVKRTGDEPWEAEDPHSPDICADTSARDMCEQIRRALPPRWYSVLSLHYVKGLSFEEVGKQLGMSRERARQIVRKAAKRAREVFPEWVQAI